MAAIATVDGLKRNIPETMAHLTGGEYFHFTDAKSLERDLATIGNELPNRYAPSFYPDSPHEGLHTISVSLPGCDGLEIEARTRYWVDGPVP